MKKTQLKFLIPFLLIFISCTSTNNKSAYNAKKLKFNDGTDILTSETYLSSPDSLHLVFAGDIMAHTNVTLRGDFDIKFSDIKPIINNADFSFANFETPVCNEKEYSSYPFFNVKSDYAQSCINAGFNVFSLANNHSNDQNLEGIKSTYKFFSEKETETRESVRPVYACGLKENEGNKITYRLMEKNDWKILFFAVTEILNQPTYTSWIDFIRPTETARNNFIQEVNLIKQETMPDITVISFHCSEEEYVRTIPAKQKAFYKKLIKEACDILWVNHPHVPKEWEFFPSGAGNSDKLIFYGVGNTISGQRYKPDFSDPSGWWEYTGDSFITTLVLQKQNGSIKIRQIDPVPITTYITPQKEYIIKILNADFINELKENRQTTWAKYLDKRLELLEKVKGITTWE